VSAAYTGSETDTADQCSNAVREPDDEIVPVRHFHLRQGLGVDLVVLAGQLVGRQQKSRQRIDLLILYGRLAG